MVASVVVVDSPTAVWSPVNETEKVRSDDGPGASRRNHRMLLREAGAVGLGAVAFGAAGYEAAARALAGAATSTGSQTASAALSCVLTPEATEGRLSRSAWILR
jgi:hypothetical protein